MDTFHPNGQLKARFHYKDGRLDGPLLVFYENGLMESKDSTKMVNWMGFLKLTMTTVKSNSEGSIKRAIKLAPAKVPPNGRLRAKNHYRDGKLDGIHEIYHSNGDLRHRGRFKGDSVAGHALIVTQNSLRGSFCSRGYFRQQQ